MILRYDHWQMVQPSEWPIVHFEPREMASRLNGSLLVDLEFMKWLDEVRVHFGRPMVVSSGYRTPAHQEQLTSRKTGAHVDGQAADILTPTAHLAWRLVESAMYGMAHGIGIDLRPSVGHGSHYVHLDRWHQRGADEPVMWGYG